jgi:hypothetical protein
MLIYEYCRSAALCVYTVYIFFMYRQFLGWVYRKKKPLTIFYSKLMMIFPVVFYL